MPKKMAPTSRAKNKNLFTQYPFLTIFNTKKGIMKTNIHYIIIYKKKLYNHPLAYIHIYTLYNHPLVYIHINNHPLAHIHK